MKTFKVAVIGCGSMGWADIKTLKKSAHVSEIIGFEPGLKRRQDTAQEFGIEVVGDLESIWKNEDIKLVFITSPNSFHTEQGIAAMRSGKSVMMEKPMGINQEELKEILRVQKETGMFFQLGFECRYSKLYARVKAIIDSGEIGEVKHIDYNYHISPYEENEGDGRNWKFSLGKSGGIFQEKLCHYVDLARWWISKPLEECFSVKAPNTIPYFEIPDNVHSLCRFKGGAVFHLSFMMQGADGSREIDGRKPDSSDHAERGHVMKYKIVGTEGALESDLFKRRLQVYYHPGKSGSERGELVREEKWEKGEDHTYVHNTSDQNLDIAERVAAGLPPGISPEDAAESMDLCFKLEHLSESNNWTAQGL